MIKKTKRLILIFAIIITATLTSTIFAKAEFFKGAFYKIPTLNKKLIIKKNIEPTIDKSKEEAIGKRINRFGYESILGTPSLAQVKENLQDMQIGDINGYKLVLTLLENYNGNKTNTIKKGFLEENFSNYDLDNKEEEYLIRVTHGLWVEKNKIVPWSLKDYSQEEIEWLFFIDPFENTEEQDYHFEIDNHIFTANRYSDNLKHDASYKLFLLSKNFIKEDTENTIKETLRWQKKNFFHASGEWGWENYTDPEVENQTNIFGLPYPNTLERLFEERITGCNINAFLLTDLLRSLNIPALHLRAGHAVTYLPTMNKYIHGDHIAMFVTVPINSYFLTQEEFLGIIHSNSRGGDTFMRAKFPGILGTIASTDLLRAENTLYIDFFANCDERVKNIMEEEVAEYILEYDERECQFTGINLPIQTLEEPFNLG